MSAFGQPVTFNRKLYVRGAIPSTSGEDVLEYSPDCDQWAKLPPLEPIVDNFTLATLQGQLLVVGGRDESTHKNTRTILTFDEQSHEWIRSYPAMPRALARPAVIGYGDHLIVAGGECSDTNNWIPDVYILDIHSNKWILTSEQLPSPLGYYRMVLSADTLYLTLQFGSKDQSSDEKTVLRAHVPTLISGVMSGVWETFANIPYSHCSLIAIGNTLLTLGGTKKQFIFEPTTSVQIYSPTTKQWIKVGDLPERMSGCHCVSLLGELFVLGWYMNSSVYSSKPIFTTAL